MKNSTKKNGDTDSKEQFKRLNKEELIDKMYHYLDCQTEIAERKRVQFYDYEANPSYDKNDNLKKNPYLSEFNNQVDAIARTSAAIIKISSSDLEDEEINESNKKKHKELVD